MQTALTVSIVLNVLLTGALIYLYRTEDKRRKKPWFDERLQASARDEYARLVDIGRRLQIYR